MSFTLFRKAALFQNVVSEGSIFTKNKDRVLASVASPLRLSVAEEGRPLNITANDAFLPREDFQAEGTKLSHTKGGNRCC